jgi:uncharacterized protein YjbI with pentapeptide repeats
MPLCNIDSSHGNLDGIDFSGADLYGCGLGEPYGTLTAQHARFVGTYLAGGEVGNADLSYSDFSHANLSGVDIGESNLTGVNFSSANLSNASPYRNWQLTNFTSANFTNANLSGVLFIKGMPGMVFTGVIWSNTTCPDGTNSDADGHTCVGHFLFGV